MSGGRLTELANSGLQPEAPWYRDERPVLLDELRRELGTDHVLYGLRLSVLASRRDRDDVLVAINDGTSRVAKVHLTWSQRTETPPWPMTNLFASIESWADAMRFDHAEYGE
jgi:hypothetical protein